MRKLELEGVKVCWGKWGEWEEELEKHWGRFWGVAPVALHPISLASEDKKIRNLLNQIDCVLPDSKWHQWVLRWSLGVKADQFYGPELMKRVIELVSKKGGGVFLFGGRDEEQMKKLVSWSRVVGGEKLMIEGIVPSMPVKEEEVKRLVEMVRRRGEKVKVVFLGVGSPRQHELLVKLKGKIDCPVIAVGAAFDMWGGVTKMCPRWLRQIGGEWFWRWVQEPKRLRKRNWQVFRWLMRRGLSGRG